MTPTLVLDTDHMSLLEWGSDEVARLRERLADCSEGEVATTINDYQLRGTDAWLDGIHCRCTIACQAS